MKKISFIILFILSVSSCKLIDEKENTTEILSTTVLKDTMVVNDKDENGCLASAGYIWSKVNKSCVKGFSGIQLNPFDNSANEDETLSAYVLFNEDASQAEIFLPKDTSSIVLSRSDEGKPWVYKDWKLIPWKGYVLKKREIDKFTGDGQIGKKITESDTEQ